MRRAIPAALITIAGMGALVSFKTTSPVPTKPAAATAPPASASAPSTRASAPPASAPPPPTDGTTAPTTGTAAAKTYDGDPVDNQYGTVQVRITVQSRHVTAVEALQLPFDRQRSAFISEQAEPYLRQEALQAQSANIDIVSGATYTSASYIQSLQSALDKAGI